jgi:hypothetical protein
MTKRTTTVLTGLALAAVYVAAAALSGHLSIFDRRPLLDGFAPPPPYRWVSPPPSLASSNQPPLPGKATVPFQAGKSQAGVFRTNDSQIVLVLLGGAIPPKAGQTSVSLTIDPVAPKAVGPPPSGEEITGNVYRMKAVYKPGGAPVTTLAVGAELVMVYPAPPQKGLRHILIVSADGKKWHALHSNDSPIQHQVSSEGLKSLGYAAIAVPAGSSTPAPSSGGGGGSPVVVIVVIGAVIVLIVVAALEIRRRRRSGGGGGHSSGPLRGSRR